jgi:hypothetical protein
MVVGNFSRIRAFLVSLQGELRESKGIATHYLPENPKENNDAQSSYHNSLNSVNIPSLTFTCHFMIDQSAKTPSKWGFGMFA